MVSARFPFAVIAYVVVTSNALAPSAFAAEDIPTLYGETCAVCHGFDGTGEMPGVPDLSLPDSPLLKPDTDLVQSIVNGIDYPGIETPMLASGLEPDTARALLEHLRETVNGTPK